MVRTSVFEFNQDRMDRTTGAASIDVSGAQSIIFDDETTFYFGSATSKTFTVVACYPVGCSNESSIHVDAAVGYALM